MCAPRVRSDLFARAWNSIYVVCSAWSLCQVPRSVKGSGKYASYVGDLAGYLADFLGRTQPLVDVTALVSAGCTGPFAEAWACGRVPGWEHRLEATAEAEGKALDLSRMRSVAEVEALGGDRLKSACVALGLKSGGTPKDRAARLWSSKGLKPEDFPKKILAPKKAGEKTGEKGDDEAGAGGEAGKRKREGPPFSGAKGAAHSEAVVAFLAGELADVVAATKRRVEKKHTMRRGKGAHDRRLHRTCFGPLFSASACLLASVYSPPAPCAS